MTHRKGYEQEAKRAPTWLGKKQVRCDTCTKDGQMAFSQTRAQQSK